MKITALVPAAGFGLRLNLDVVKPLVKIQKKPIIIHTLLALSAHPLIDEIILVFNKDGLKVARDLIKKHKILKVSRIISGGATRKESVKRGLDVVDMETELIVVHDGARPFVDEKSITRVIEEAKISGAAVLGVPVKPTIKIVDSHKRITQTLKREGLWEIQTPQVFERKLIQKAYIVGDKYMASDDASLVELTGKKVKVVMGSYFNIKITTKEDLVFAEAILKNGKQ